MTLPQNFREYVRGAFRTGGRVMTGLFCPLAVRWLQSIEPSPPTTTLQIPSTWIGILAEVSDYLEAYKLARQFLDADEKPLLLESDDA
jgi:hypothetical protein